MNYKLPKVDDVSSGQALLLVLIGMGAAMVLVLSVVSRSITDISITSKDDEAARAFSAAEAGVENLLIGGDATNPNIGNSSGYEGVKTDLAEGETSYNIPTGIVSGEYATVWFVPHDEATGKMNGSSININKLKVCWGNENATGATPALELSVYYDDTPGPITPSLADPPDYSGVGVFRAAFDSPLAGRGNGFETDGVDSPCTVGGQNYLYSKEIIIASLNDLLFARTRLLYNEVAQNVGVVITGDTLPSQGKRIESVGTSGDATRKVEVLQTYKDVLPFIDNALYSGNQVGGISK